MDRTEDLIARLESHRPRDEEKVFLRRMLELASSPEDPFVRTRFDPGHFTASSFIVSPTLNSLLLLHHAKLERWLQPGGHVEPEDVNILEAAHREAKEETGLTDLHYISKDGLFDVDIHPIPGRSDEPAHEHFDVRFAFVSKSLDFSTSSESHAARWVPFAELSRSEFSPSLQRVVSKLRAVLL